MNICVHQVDYAFENLCFNEVSFESSFTNSKFPKMSQPQIILVPVQGQLNGQQLKVGIAGSEQVHNSQV